MCMSLFGVVQQSTILSFIFENCMYKQIEFQVSHRLFTSPTDQTNPAAVYWYPLPFIGTAAVADLFATVYNLSNQHVNLSLSKLSEHSLFLSQNMVQKGLGMTAHESNSSSCVHNYATTMGDSHARMHFIFWTGICCGTKISAPCWFVFCTLGFFSLQTIFFSTESVLLPWKYVFSQAVPMPESHDISLSYLMFNHAVKERKMIFCSKWLSP